MLMPLIPVTTMTYQILVGNPLLSHNALQNMFEPSASISDQVLHLDYHEHSPFQIHVSMVQGESQTHTFLIIFFLIHRIYGVYVDMGHR